MATKDYLFTASGYVNKGIGLKHGDPTISIRVPLEKKQELEILIDRLITLGKLDKTEGKQGFLRGLIYKAMEENSDLLEKKLAVAPAVEPPAPAKKTRAKKAKEPYWVHSSQLYLHPHLLSEQDYEFVKTHPNSWFLVQEPATKISKWLDVKD